VIHSAFELLSHSPEAYVIVFAFALVDGVFPVVPSETALITAGLLCVVGELSLPWVIAAGAVGAIAGDNISYALGRYVGKPVQERFLDGRRARQALGWARGQFERRGGLVVLVGRYVPGGRTAATFTGGVIHYPWLRFAAFDVVAGAAWAVYAAVLGYVGGRFFEHHAWVALLVAFGLAALVTLAVEGGRRLWRHGHGAE
jgi:membrane protein DedA with SNARE-associated domain